MLIAGAMPAAASAADLSFSQLPDGTATVWGEPGGPMGPERLEVLRDGVQQGAPLQSIDWGSGMALSSLQVGDEARYYVNGSLKVAYVYDGLPALSQACAGATTLTIGRGAFAKLVVRTGTKDVANWIQGNASAGDPSTVTFARPVVAGDLIEMSVSGSAGAPNVSEFRSVSVVDCSAPPPPPAAPRPPVAPATDEQVLAALKATLATAAKRLRRTSTAMRFALPEPGTLTVRLKRGTVIVASGRRAGSGKVAIALKVTHAGRRLLRRAHRTRVTVSATFAPARAGADVQSATAKAVLKRR
jgi:hypothetical protein